MITIVGIDKAKLLVDLYIAAKYQGCLYSGDRQKHLYNLVVMQNRQTDTYEAEVIAAQLVTQDNKYFEEVNLGSGTKIIKIDFSGEQFDETEYDNHHGAGAAQKVVNSINLWKRIREVHANAGKTWGKIAQNFKETTESVKDDTDHKDADEPRKKMKPPIPL